MPRLSFSGIEDTSNVDIPRTESQNQFLDDLADEIEAHEEPHFDSVHVKEQRPFLLKREAWLLFRIAIPIVTVQLSMSFIFPMCASVVGRKLGSNELAGFSLASLTGNLTILSVMIGALSAADTLMPRAYGMGRYTEVGRLAIRGFVMCLVLLIPPIVPLCSAMEWIFDKLGQDPTAAELASQWIRTYLLGVPFLLLFRTVQSFLTAQHVTTPMLYVSVVCCFVIHPIILHILVYFFGFIGSSLAVAFTNTALGVLVVAYLGLFPESFNQETWPGLSRSFIQESLKPGPVVDFLKLGLGGVLTLSEWWFWECTCFIVGTFGITSLCVHTIAYQLVPVLFMIPLGLSIGLTVRMGNVLARDVPRAKKMAILCMVLTVVVGAVVAGLLYQLRDSIVLLFTTDPVVLEGCDLIWPRLCYFIFILYVFGINSAILRALGLQWPMAMIIFLCLWCVSLPTMIYFAILKQGGLDAVWTVLPIGYTVMQVLLMAMYMTVDWQRIGNEIREHTRKSLTANMSLVKEMMEAAPSATEATPLIMSK